MKDFAYMEESRTGRKVAINPSLVRIVVQYDDKRVAVVFDHQHEIYIDGTVAQVSEVIRRSMQ